MKMSYTLDIVQNVKCEYCKSSQTSNLLSNENGILLCSNCNLSDSVFIHLHQFKVGDVVRLKCLWLGKMYESELVQVSVKYLNKIFKEISCLPKHKQKRIFADTLRDLLLFTPNVLESYRKKNNDIAFQWDKNLALGVILRTILLNRPIEILTPEKHLELTKIEDEMEKQDSKLKWADFQRNKKTILKDQVAIYAITYCYDEHLISIVYKNQPKAYQIIKEMRKEAIKLKENFIINTKDFTDWNGCQYYALLLGNNEPSSCVKLFLEGVFGENISNGEVVFFNSKNKRDKTFNWITKNK